MLQNKNILLDITKRKDNTRDPFHYFLVYKVQYEKNLNIEELKTLKSFIEYSQRIEERGYN